LSSPGVHHFTTGPANVKLSFEVDFILDGWVAIGAEPARLEPFGIVLEG